MRLYVEADVSQDDLYYAVMRLGCSVAKRSRSYMVSIDEDDELASKVMRLLTSFPVNVFRYWLFDDMNKMNVSGGIYDGEFGIEPVYGLFSNVPEISYYPQREVLNDTVEQNIGYN